MKSNYLYLCVSAFSSDLLFWIVIDNLFMTAVKGFTPSQVVLLTVIGLAFSIALYPLSYYIVKKTSNKVANIIGSVCYLGAIILFMFTNTMIGYGIGKVLYHMASPFRQAAAVMLRNNLHAQGKDDQFVTWRSYGRLCYAIITAVIAAVSGLLFNVYAYLPVILALACAVLSLIFTILYSEPPQTKVEAESKVSFKRVISHRLMWELLITNIVAVGCYCILSDKATLLLKVMCEDSGMSIAFISILTSVMVLVARVVRVVANLLFPTVFKRTNRKQLILIAFGLALMMSGVFFAIGANVKTNIYVNIVLISLGYLIIAFIRDVYANIENELIIRHIPLEEQKQALVLANIYGLIGRLIVILFVYFVLSATTINMAYLLTLVFAVGQLASTLPLARYLKTDEQHSRKYEDSISPDGEH